MLSGGGGGVARSVFTTPPPTFTSSLVPRESYDTPVEASASAPAPASLAGVFGPTVTLRLGDVVLARSGDKGPNLNVGFFVRGGGGGGREKNEEEGKGGGDEGEGEEDVADLAWRWLRAYLSRERFITTLVGAEDWPAYNNDQYSNDEREPYHVERVEFAGIRAVHFVVYGFLGRGVGSCARLDCFAKGFADYVRDRWVEVPRAMLALRSKDGRVVEEIERGLRG
ncbi:uncharacterized protein BKCO1_900001 [Diplodia corticola]|uniref:AtuA-like ferredoxin-fold domain-containing protein n=1 Tax=Diplodia corticola TaxID=236234 RepID=A0A1J9RNI6_9PEZI|nr:uncharacterized protein BKCO1_900001 [Diplodia corticola]OJD29157.1 hypothetical protein BKCO1_900001 [Diplodia corticola]